MEEVGEGVGVVTSSMEGASLSRRWMVWRVEASSTQLLPSPPPENDDFCQFWGVVIGAPHSSFVSLWMKSRDRSGSSDAAFTLRKSVRKALSWALESMKATP